MRSSDERIAQMHMRAGRLARERARRRFSALCAGAGAVGAALAVALGLAVSDASLSLPGGPAPESRMASIFVRNGALGYVFVAVLAFILGVLFTAFCVLLKKHLTEKEQKNDREL